MKSRKIIISVVALIFINVLVISAQDKFSESECVSRWTTEVDRPFRLTRATAIKRCSAIALRIETISKQILGKWQLIGSKERKETLEFFNNGTCRREWFDVATRNSGNLLQGWAIVNPYGTLGAEVIQFADDYLREIKISGGTMTIISTPTRYSYTDRYKRIITEVKKPVTPAETMESRWKTFWTQFSAAVKARNKASVKRLMVTENNFLDGGGGETRSEWLNRIAGCCWRDIQKSVAGGTTSYIEAGFNGKITKDRTLLFQYTGGKWYFAGVMGD